MGTPVALCTIPCFLSIHLVSPVFGSTIFCCPLAFIAPGGVVTLATCSVVCFVDILPIGLPTVPPIGLGLWGAESSLGLGRRCSAWLGLRRGVTWFLLSTLIRVSWKRIMPLVVLFFGWRGKCSLFLSKS